jgi:transposase
MDPEPDLTTLSREELMAVIAEQKAIIAQLRQRVAALEARLNTRGSPGMPGNKPPSTRRPPKPRGPRKPRPDGFARQRMTPAQRVEHALETCPDCGTGLAGGWVHRTREVIEIPLVPAQVTEHVIIARVCPICERRRIPKVEWAGLVVGKQRFGVNLVSLIVTLREEGRLPLRIIQWYLKTVHELHLSVGGIVQVIHRVAQQAQLPMTKVLERIRASPVVHADETGWRQDGGNGYVWTFSTPTERYFLRRSRGKGAVDEVLADSFSGVLVSDFYAAYNHYPGPKQRCWAHLLRDIHDLKVLYPEDPSLHQWAESVHKLYADAKASVIPQAPPFPQRAQQRRLAQLGLERKLLAHCRPFLNDPLAVQGKLCRRIERFIKELFVFVAEPAVPPDNNTAERSLRHLVTSRKISGGTRSEHGTYSKMALASLFGTWRARGLNPLLACRQLLTSPQV